MQEVEGDEVRWPLACRRECLGAARGSTGLEKLKREPSLLSDNQLAVQPHPGGQLGSVACRISGKAPVRSASQRERRTAIPASWTSGRHQNPSHFGSAVWVAGRSGLLTAMASIGSGNDHFMTGLFQQSAVLRMIGTMTADRLAVCSCRTAFSARSAAMVVA